MFEPWRQVRLRSVDNLANSQLWPSIDPQAGLFRVGWPGVVETSPGANFRERPMTCGFARFN